MNRITRRTLAWLPLTFVALAFLPVSLPVAGDAGRDYSRCIHACNSARQACGDQCETDCRALFPQGTEGRGACISQCKAGCIDADRTCRAVCKAIKNGVTPEEPS